MRAEQRAVAVAVAVANAVISIIDMILSDQQDKVAK